MNPATTEATADQVPTTIDFDVAFSSQETSNDSHKSTDTQESTDTYAIDAMLSQDESIVDQLAGPAYTPTLEFTTPPTPTSAPIMNNDESTDEGENRGDEDESLSQTDDEDSQVMAWTKAPLLTAFDDHINTLKRDFRVCDITREALLSDVVTLQQEEIEYELVDQLYQQLLTARKRAHIKRRKAAARICARVDRLDERRNLSSTYALSLRNAVLKRMLHKQLPTSNNRRAAQQLKSFRMIYDQE
ncbi:hypothetical protein BCR43DRAFT_509253 [Syncephalastrum racemosum]|uniref:Uncharacterized protein n=1 Tax=Syncephalastrum racemosum TaxID=13706 RepID=A0A1X2GZ33_SYNRA|nr:hypothetical protein BCR43DRAFT_509253 [Syncephalastrum racemosum]